MSFPFFFDGTSNIFINGSLGIGTTLPQASFHSEGISYFAGNVGVGTTTPRTKLEIHSQDGVLLPRGTSAQRPTASLRGYIRYNTDTNQFEGLGAADQWGSLGGVKSTDQSTYISAELTPGANDCNLRFYNNNNLNMIVNPLGNVGIGTTLPNYALDVNGSIQATNFYGNASGLCNLTNQLMWINGGGLRVANQKLVVDGDLFLGGQIFGGCNTSGFSGGATLPSVISPNVVTGSNIVDGSVTFGKLDPSAYNFQWMVVTGGGLRTTQKVIIDGDLILGGDIISSSNFNQLYPGGAVLGCNIAVGAVTSSNIADGSITFSKLDPTAYNFQWMAVTGGGLRTSQKVVIDSDLIIGGNIYNASNVNLNDLYPGGAILGCNIGVGVISTSNLVDRAVTSAKVDFSSNMPLSFGGNVSISGSISAGNMYTFRNAIINGDMRVNQRVTSTNTASPATVVTAFPWSWVADRWNVYRTTNVSGGSMVLVPLTTSDLPYTDAGILYGARVIRGSGNATTNNLNLVQSLENTESMRLVGKSATLSFYYRTGANFSGTNLIGAVYSGTGTDQALRDTVTGLATVATMSCSATSGAWAFTSATGTVSSSAKQLFVGFNYTPSGTAGANDWFEVTGVQLEKGNLVTPFEMRPFSTELALCQRYYQQSYDYGTVAGTAYTPAVWGDTAITARVPNQGGGNMSAIGAFSVPMRSTPVITLYDGAGTSGMITILDSGTWRNNRGPATYDSNVSMRRIYVQGTFSTSCSGISYHYTVNSEL